MIVNLYERFFFSGAASLGSSLAPVDPPRHDRILCSLARRGVWPSVFGLFPPLIQRPDTDRRQERRARRMSRTGGWRGARPARPMWRTRICVSRSDSRSRRQATIGRAPRASALLRPSPRGQSSPRRGSRCARKQPFFIVFARVCFAHAKRSTGSRTTAHGAVDGVVANDPRQARSPDIHRLTTRIAPSDRGETRAAAGNQTRNNVRTAAASREGRQSKSSDRKYNNPVAVQPLTNK